jgi:hypothetical protein
MPDLAAFAAKFAEPRNLFPQRLGDRAYYRNRFDIRKHHPRLCDDVGRYAELALPLQKLAVLFLDFGASHFLIPKA